MPLPVALTYAWWCTHCWKDLHSGMHWEDQRLRWRAQGPAVPYLALANHVTDADSLSLHYPDMPATQDYYGGGLNNE